MPAAVPIKVCNHYMAKRASGLSQEAAAAASGISMRTAQRIDQGQHQPERGKKRGWRTRLDPLEGVWEEELVPMLEQAPELEPQTLLLHLEEKHPEQDWLSRKRTLQRRVGEWKTLNGPAKEVIFLQEHKAGVMGISDFTQLDGDPITSAGEILEHRFYHFRLPFSGWCHTEVVHGGESFVALAECLQNALAGCGGIPAEHRSDSLSACFRNRNGSYKADYTCRYNELCAHLGLTATRNNKGVAHENGAIEGPHAHFKRRLRQQLIKRGSRDFASEKEYEDLVCSVRDSLNRRSTVQQKWLIEKEHLQPLPVYRYPDYEIISPRVRSTSTIQVREVTYSVPSRLIGQRLSVHLYHDRLLLHLGSHFIASLPRLHRRKGQKGALRRIDFRHLIDSLRRKPRALLRAQLLEEILPNEEWRAIWRQLLRSLPADEAAKGMVDALYAAAHRDDLEAVQHYMERHLRKGDVSLEAIRRRYGLRPPRPDGEQPQVVISEPSLQSYDQLLDGTAEPHSPGGIPACAVETVETGRLPQPVAAG